LWGAKVLQGCFVISKLKFNGKFWQKQLHKKGKPQESFLFVQWWTSPSCHMSPSPSSTHSLTHIINPLQGSYALFYHPSIQQHCLYHVALEITFLVKRAHLKSRKREFADRSGNGLFPLFARNLRYVCAYQQPSAV
jgi:hypothetical protein